MQTKDILLTEARASAWDVIIAGSSFASMFFAQGLPPGLRILIVEKGDRVTHAEWLDNLAHTEPAFSNLNTSGRPKDWVTNTVFGGNSNCWWAQTPRMHPADFQTKARYGVGTDWPIGYDDLEPFYADVEDIMEISGGGSDHILPRSRAFPYPPHVPSRTDALFREKRPDIWFAAPTARSNGGSRSACCSNGICHTCPIDAKFTVINGLTRLRDIEVSLLLGAEVRSVVVEAGKARAVEVRMRDGTSAELRGSVIALATNAMFNASILLRSDVKSTALGHYLCEQISDVVSINIRSPNYFGGTSITGHCYGAYDGDHRRDAGAVLIENFNAPASLRADAGRWTERLVLKLIAEDLPNFDNKVDLDAQGDPVAHWTGHSDYARRGLDHALETLADLIPVEIDAVVSVTESNGEAHIQGTHRMGLDPANSVTDPTLRVHGVENLFALGSGAFASCPPANPTLTLSALSLRSGRSLQ